MPLKYKANIELLTDSKDPIDQTYNNTLDESRIDSNSQRTVLTNPENVLVLEHAKFGSFLDLIKKMKLEISQIRELFIHASEALEYLHCKYIVHRDIKLDNILITTNGEVMVAKLADFGFARACFNPETNNLLLFNTFKGTKRGYMAPEIHEVLKNPEKYYDGRKSDIFALGVVLFAAVLGSLPFEYATM